MIFVTDSQNLESENLTLKVKNMAKIKKHLFFYLTYKSSLVHILTMQSPEGVSFEGWVDLGGSSFEHPVVQNQYFFSLQVNSS